jgi:hypothetical protein
MEIGKSNSLIIIVGIVTALLVGSSYLFLQTSGAQRPTVAAKAPDTPKNLGETTLSQSAYPPSPVGANPTKIEGYRPPPYIHNVVQRQEAVKPVPRQPSLIASPLQKTTAARMRQSFPRSRLLFTERP